MSFESGAAGWEGRVVKRNHVSIGRTILALWCTLYIGASWAQAPASYAHNNFVFEDELNKRRNMRVLDESLFGDKVNLQDGSIVFEQTDIALPLNGGRQITLGRRMAQGKASGGIFGDWALNVPRMRATYDARDGWNSGTLDGYRCSRGNFVPRDVNPAIGGGFPISPFMYWNGIAIELPDQGVQTLLRKNAAQVMPTDGKVYVATTKQQGRISCLPALKNGAGEGFELTTADGTRYQFDWMATYDVEDLKTRTYSWGEQVIVPLTQYILYASRVIDRFGNTISYNFDSASPHRITSMVAAEGARIDVAYGADGRVSTATANGRVWQYTYGTDGLATVLLPDGSSWGFSGNYPKDLWWLINASNHPSCNNPYTYAGSSTSGYGLPPSTNILPDFTRVLRHPSGAVGTFVLRASVHGTNNTPGECFFGVGTQNLIGVPSIYASVSLIQKKIEGSGLDPREWRYTYAASWSMDCPNNVCAKNTSETSIWRSDGVTRNYSYGNNYRTNAGLLLAESTVKDGIAVQSKTHAYNLSAAGQSYPANAGDVTAGPPRVGNFGRLYPEVYGNPLDASHRPNQSVVTTVDGSTMTRRIDAFDRFARPVQAAKYSSAASKTETTEYHDNLQLWSLGSLARSTVDGIEAGRVEYGSNALPFRKYAFGRLVETLGYYTDGTLASVTEPSGAVTTYSVWRAGVPQRVQYPATPEAPTGAVETATVDDNGWITSFTNEVGGKTCYDYNGVGRMTGITPPHEASPGMCDTAQATANATRIAFDYVTAGAEYGIPANHWRRTVTQGDLRELTYFDALFQPLVDERYDAASAAGTRSVVARQFSLDGALAYESYPQRSLAAYNSGVPGRRMTYDALVRPTREVRDSELGSLTATTDYLANFQRRVTNPRGYATITTHRVFDNPGETDIVAISAPESATVNIARDVFGKPTAITRGGAGASATRRYVYDGYQRLCKTIEPETGANVQAYDAGNNIAWRASGLGLTAATSCDQASVPETSKVSYGYDARNRLTSTTYGDGSPSTSSGHTADGLLSQISSDGSTWNYAYNNSRRALTNETLTFVGTSYSFVRGIDANGNLTSLTYPGGPTVFYSPNALGQPTQASGYASAVSYHPNGAIAGYTLANGIVHSMSQNTRGLPAVWRDAGVVQDSYGFDANANVSSIADQQENLSSRAMGYDGLDRMTTANGIWGTGSFTYDPLDNLRSSTVGARTLVHNIDAATNRLTSLSGSQSVAFAYDANGNITQRGTQGFGFDIGNRVRFASGKATYAYDGHGRRTLVGYSNGSSKLQAYSKSGQLLYTSHSAEGLTRHVYLGKRLIAEVNSISGVSYSHTDALGSPVARTNAAGQLLDRTRYEPYGATATGTNPKGIGFTGHVNDADTGLVYMQQRYYEPLAGRFLSVDPVTTDAKTGDHFNRYVYAENNPYVFTDPNGRAPVREDMGAGSGRDGLGARNLDGTPVRHSVAESRANLQAAREVNGLSQNAASREAKREAGIPTSQQPASQTNGKVTDAKTGEQVSVGRQQTYDVPKPGGGTQTMSVQVSRDTQGAHKGMPQIEAGKVKEGGQTDAAGRPRIQNEDKVRVDFLPRRN
jgi:RHS repeat-associated protein